MGLNKQQQMLAAKHDLRSMAFLVKFVDERRNDNSVLGDRAARRAALQDLLREHKLLGLGVPYGSETPWNHDAQSLLNLIARVLRTPGRRVSGYADSTAVAAIQDDFFSNGSTMLSKEYRAELQSALDEEPVPTPPDSEEERLNEAASAGSDESYKAAGKRQRRPTLKKMSSARNKPLKKPQSSKRTAKLIDDDDDEAHEEPNETEKPAASASTQPSRPSGKAIVKSRQPQASTKQRAVKSVGRQVGLNTGKGNLVPERKISGVRAGSSKYVPSFPNLKAAPSSHSHRNDSDNQQANKGYENANEANDRAELEDEEEDDQEDENEEIEQIEQDDNGNISVNRKRAPRRASEDTSRARKRAKTYKDLLEEEDDSAPVPRKSHLAATANKSSKSGQIERRRSKNIRSLPHTQTSQQDEDEELALLFQREEYQQPLDTPERDGEMSGNTSGMTREELARLDGSPPVPTRYNALSQMRGKKVGEGSSRGLGGRTKIAPLNRQPAAGSALAGTTAPFGADNHHRAQSSSTPDIMTLDLPHAMLKIDGLLDQALVTVSPEGEIVNVASIAMEPSRSLTRLYAVTFGHNWLKLAGEAMRAEDADVVFTAPTILKSLIWHYLAAEILSKEVLSDTVYTLLGKIRAYVQPVLEEQNDGFNYSYVLRRASEAQFQSAEFLGQEVAHCAQELETRLTMILRQHLVEMETAKMPESWRKDFSTSLVEICRQTLLLRAKLGMEEEKHEVLVVGHQTPFDGAQMEAEGGRGGEKVLFTKMPGIKKTATGGQSQVVVKALVALSPASMDV